MMLLRMLAAAAKPAIVTGALATSAAGAWLVYDNYSGDPPTAFERLQGAGQRLLVSEFGANADTIVSIDPSNVAGSREVIATIDHAPEYGIVAALSPDASAVAYTALPVDANDPGPGSPAIAGLVLQDGTTTVLANDVDLVVAPVWSPDNASIVVRKNTPCEDAGLSCDEYPAGAFELVLLGLDGSRSTLTSWRSAAAFPIAFSPDGTAFYFATLNANGTDLYRVAPDGSSETQIAHLSDEVARDWKLSPDGTRIAYSAAESGQAPAIVARVVDLATGAISDALNADALAAGPPSTGVARGEFNPAWAPGGELTVASMNLDGGAGAVSVEDGVADALTSGVDGMDLPLSWSPDGAALAVRAVDGETPFDAGASYVEIVGADGERERVSESSDLSIVGWTE
jgi:Tol biopolymer transport system component